MRNAMIFSILAPLALAACASSGGPSASERLAMYMAHSDAPVRSIRYRTPIGWDKVDRQHLLLTMRPTEVYLLRISGPCLEWGGASPTIQISTQVNQLSVGFDRISVPQSPASCRIEEIRPVDIAAVRASQRAMASS